MSETLTLDGLTVPMRALRRLALDFPHLPAPSLAISTIFPERLELSLHDDLGAFEPWRVALRIDRDEVRFGEQSGGQTWVLQASTAFADAQVKLIAYGAALDSIREDAGGGDA